ncbi:MAG: type II toxin-antitoxin system RelE family toxin [Carbonactinosporaceae bacterium]
MTYSVKVAPSAAKALSKIERKTRLRIAGAIELLSVEPRPPRAKMLRGGDHGCWRVRIGDHRVVYTVEDGRLVVLVVRVAHRREVYDR